MTIRITRYEKVEAEIFLTVEVTDESGVYQRSEWLLPSDVVLVVANESYIDTVAQQIADRAVIAHSVVTPADGFSSELFYNRMAAVLTIAQQTQLAQMAPNFMIALQVRDFKNVRQIMDYVVSLQPGAEAMDTIIRALLLEQGVDLATF